MPLYDHNLFFKKNLIYHLKKENYPEISLARIQLFNSYLRGDLTSEPNQDWKYPSKHDEKLMSSYKRALWPGWVTSTRLASIFTSSNLQAGKGLNGKRQRAFSGNKTG